MILSSLFNNRKAANGRKAVDQQIEEIKNEIESGSAVVVQRLSNVQKQIRRSKKTIVLEIGSAD